MFAHGRPEGRKWTEKAAEKKKDPELQGLVVADFPESVALTVVPKIATPEIPEEDAQARNEQNDFDTLEWFVLENLIIRPGGWEPAQEAYQAYVAFCDGNTRLPMSMTAFGCALPEMGMEKKTGGRVRYMGIRLKPSGPRLLEQQVG